MFDSIKNLGAQLLGGGGSIDPQALEQAVTDHIGNTDAGELGDHLQTAASNLQQQGQGDLAQQAIGIVSKLQSDPAGAKDEAIAFITNNPDIIQHFAPDFAKGILAKLGA